MAAKTMEWRPGPTVCRCCLAEGCYKDISTEYFWMGKREVYSEMLSETFSVSIAYSTAGGPNSNSRLICEPCISRLRDASDFKRQVQECERTFMQHLDPGSTSTAGCELTVEPEDVKIETVKLEAHLSDVDVDDGPDFGDDDDDDLDDEPLTKFATKVPKKESVDLLDLIDNSKAAEKRKSTTKVKATPAKKTKKETVKPTSSKPKPEKKKKGPEVDPTMDLVIATVNWKRKRSVAEDKANAALILQHSNAVPFRNKFGKFMCAYCPLFCANCSELRVHTMKHDKLSIFETTAEVRNSFPLRIDITDLKCNICDKGMDTMDHLKEHLVKEHAKTLNPKYGDELVPFILTRKEYKCVNCNAELENLMNLFTHMNVHYQSFVCHICGKGFSGKHKLFAHRRSHDTGEYACSQCELVFTSRAALNRHRTLAHRYKDRYRCPVCELHFESYYSRLKHLERVHGQRKEYPCDSCPAIFATISLRNSHVQRGHRRDRKTIRAEN
ncbi:myoneurin-like isoform X16 [Achroia grisella]|uniref:myoneurin-like isoform X16 n=1 Tax=Achroia grisella TaxID=688607 RepID=UPI0027D33D1D|nr:myoneurin-like isoform X16 [Achroia grisella]